jgi:hypothetical protein
MKGFLAVARREIEEKWFVFPAALVASLVPFAIPLMRGMHGTAAAEVREWTAMVGAWAFAGGLAAALGATTIAGELAERRIGFYFSRPISGIALWAGNLGAACFMAFSVAVLVYVPTLVAERGRVILWDPAQALGLLALGVAAVVLLFHAGAIALRPRTPLLALDVVALVLVSLAAAALIQRFVMAHAFEAQGLAEAVLINGAATALLVAGLLAVTRGRSDSRAAHRVLSATLWGTLGAAVAIVALYAGWVFSATPQDLKALETVLPAARGNWIMVQGPARGAEPAFLYDVATGRYQRAGAAWRWPILSSDGTRAVWFQPSGPNGPLEAMTWNLADPGSKPARTVLSFPSLPTAFLSEHGERLATIADGLISIYDLATGGSAGSARIGSKPVSLRGFFPDGDHFRIYRPDNWRGPADNGRLEILEFDIAAKKLATLGSIEDVESYSVSPSNDRLLVREKTRFSLRNARSGALLATLVERDSAARSLGRFVSDGRIVVPIQGPDVRLEVFDRDGRHERSVSLPARGHIAPGGEAAPGKLIVAVGSAVERVIFLVDLSTGDTRKVAERLLPVVYLTVFLSNPNYLPEPGSEATKLFYAPGGALVHFDALTGERHVILGKVESR